jgi:Thioredoxin
MKTTFKSAAIGLALATSALVLAGAGKPLPTDPIRNWLGQIAVTPEGGHIRGNPKADVKLVEYVSYSCPHCAHFATESDAAIQLSLIKSGKGSFEIRSFLRNPIDVAASLMVQCGAPAKVFGNHSAMLRGQAKWLREPSPSEITRWQSPDFTKRMRYIATDLNLYAVMIPRGYTKVQLDQCLANKPLAEQIAARTDTAYNTLGVHGTPTFFINGEVVPDTEWSGIQPRLMALTR